VNAAASERVRVSFRAQSSEGLPGVIKDLKLRPAKYAGALAIVSAYKLPRNVIDPTGSDLYGEMRALLDDEEYENFVAAQWAHDSANTLDRFRRCFPAPPP
jgi:hypothetical protein